LGEYAHSIYFGLWRKKMLKRDLNNLRKALSHELRMLELRLRFRLGVITAVSIVIV